MITFEEVKEEHEKSLLDIYNYYIENTVVTFHLDKLTINEMRGILYHDNVINKSFTIKYNGDIAGYIILGKHSPRGAFDKCADIAIYLDKKFTGKGIASKAMLMIEDYAKKVGMRVLLGVICSENENSIKLFEKMGYSHAGYLENVGEKFGRLLHLNYMHKNI